MATSAPEMAVVLQSITFGDADIATGSVIGSNIANILLVIGVAATIRAVHVGPAMRRFDTPSMAAASILTWLLARDGRISAIDGGIMMAALAAYVWAMLRRRSQPVTSALDQSDGPPPADLRRTVGRLVGGAALLAVAARLVVAGAEDLAAAAGVSELVIGLTVVSIGTSAPEIVTSLVAAVRRQHGIAIGNAVGSNLVNLLLVLGLAGAVSRGGIVVADEALRSDLPIMVGVAVCLALIVAALGGVPRRVGVACLGGYAA